MSAARKLRVGVIGAGTIGATHAEALLGAEHAELAAVCDTARERAAAFAAKFGFTAVDSRECVSQEFGVVIEACGVAATRDMAVSCAARKGVVSFIGNPADDWTIPKALFSSILRKELALHGNWNSVPDPDWREVLAHAGKELNLKDLVTARVPMADGAAAFARILSREGFHCKTILVP